MRGGFLEASVGAGEAGPTLTGTSKASIIPPVTRDQFVNPYFNGLGEFMLLRLAGIISTVGSSPGTLLWEVRIGSIAVWAQTTPTLAVSLTNKSWILELLLSQYAVGASSALRGVARLHCDGLISGKQTILLPDTSPANGNAFDAASPGLLDVQAQFSVTGNSLTVHQYNPLMPIR